MSEKIKLILVEDDEVFRIGLTVALKKSPNVDLIAVHEDGEEALTATLEKNPDVLLLDLGLPGISGIEVARQVKSKLPQIKIIALTSHAEPHIVEQALNSNIDGYCIKGLPVEKLLTVIQDVYNGIFWADAAVTSQLKKYFQSGKLAKNLTDEEATVLNTLTQREKEILKLVGQGKTNQQIAEELVISPGTVRVHVHSILAKLEVKNRQEATKFVSEGL